MVKDMMIDYYMKLINAKYPRGLEPEAFFTVPCEEDKDKDFVTAISYSPEEKRFVVSTLYKNKE
jgi:hypothetical protein